MREGKLFSIGSNFFELTKYAFIVVVIIASLVVFVGVPLLVRGESMLPNFKSGEVVIVERISYAANKPIKRGDIVAARFPADSSKTRLIKRVLGLPGERIQARSGQLFINDAALEEEYQTLLGSPPYTESNEVTLAEDEYFLVGDNRPGSSDSRLWGPVVRQDILGKVSFVIFPFNKAQFVERPAF